MLLKLLQAGHPILRKQAKQLTKAELTSAQTQQVIDYMIETLRDAPGVGIAAPQVGQSLQILIVEDKKKYHESVPEAVLTATGRKPVGLKVIVNPRLELLGDETIYAFEGCMSVDGYTAAVPRSLKVRVHGMDRKGNDISIMASGWFARILQHELDHLQGTLYIDKMRPASFMTHKNFNVHWRSAVPDDIWKKYSC